MAEANAEYVRGLQNAGVCFDSHLSGDDRTHFQTQPLVPGVKCSSLSRQCKHVKVTAQVRLSCEASIDGDTQQCAELPCFAIGDLKNRQGGTQQVI